MSQVFRKDRAVGRADDLNVQSGRRLQKLLDLRAVLADDPDVVAARFAVPLFLHVVGSEFAETVGGEQDLVGAVIGHHDLRPVDHRREHEGQHMPAERQAFPVLDLLPFCGGIQVKELVHHHEGLAVRDDRGVRIYLHKVLDIPSMVGFHMLDNQVIRLASAKSFRHIVQPLMGKMNVHRVHHGDLVVQQHIGIVGHAVRNDILSLEQVYLMVIHANILDILCYLHHNPPSEFGKRPPVLPPYCKRGRLLPSSGFHQVTAMSS